MKIPGQPNTYFYCSILLARSAKEAFLNTAFGIDLGTKSKFSCMYLIHRSTKEAFLNTAFGKFMSTECYFLLSHFYRIRALFCCGYIPFVEFENWNFPPKIFLKGIKKYLIFFFISFGEGITNITLGFWWFEFQNLSSFFSVMYQRIRINNNKKILQILKNYV